MNLSQARQYMLSLINRDRASFHLPAVSIDETAAAAMAAKHDLQFLAFKQRSHLVQDRGDGFVAISFSPGWPALEIIFKIGNHN